MFAAKFVRDDGSGSASLLKLGVIYAVNARKTNPDSLRVYLEEFDVSFNIANFEFFEIKKISRKTFEKKCSKNKQ